MRSPGVKKLAPGFFDFYEIKKALRMDRTAAEWNLSLRDPPQA